MTTRVLLLTQWFDPEPTFKGLVFAKELVRQGFDVEVVTGFPNYPGGKVYPGYRIKWLQREVIDGVQITRLPLYPNHDQSAIKRILNYLSFSVSSTFYGLFMAKRADVMYAYHPPLTVGVAACLIRLIRRIPLVYDIQDMWPDTLRATGMLNNTRALSIVAAVCRWVYKFADRIVVLSPGFARLLIERGVDKSKIDVIYNWADEVSLSGSVGYLPQEFPSSDSFRILFAGNMGKAQALDAILDAAEILKTKKCNVCFVFLGGGVERNRLIEKAVSMGLDNVIFLPAVPMSDVGLYLKSSDALLVHLRADPLFEVTIPSKTQAYMAIGKPLLMAVNGDAENLVNDAGCGVSARSEDPADIARAAIDLVNMPCGSIADMGDRSRSYYLEKLSLRVGVSRFAEIFNAIS